MGDPSGFMKHGRQAPGLLPVKERLAHHREHYQELPLETVRTQASRCMDCGVPFCMSGCPLGNLVPEWNDLVYRGRFREAVKLLHSTNNFPEFTGRVCPAPCESSCTLGINEPQVTIRLDEQTIIDKAWAEGWIQPQPPIRRSGKRVVVVGSGPAGLACAQQLNRAGHLVEVFEKHDRAGGLVMYGIPHYKLRKEIVQRRLDLLAAEGIVFRLGVEIGRDIALTDVKKTFDAVVLAVGAEAPRDLPVPGRELGGIHFAMEYLPQSNRHNWGDEDVTALHPKRQKIWAKDKKVIVIGGGDTGSDCIGTALRQGASSVVNLELLPEPPKERAGDNPWPQFARVKKVSSSVEEMLDRGGQVLYSVMTKRFLGTEDGHIKGVETVRLEWKGRTFTEIPDSTCVRDADLVLLAMGFTGPRTAIFQDSGVQLDQHGNITTDARTRMSTLEGVFAAGDCRRGQSLVVWAIAEGREVARCVDTWLMQQDSLLPRVRLEGFAF